MVTLNIIYWSNYFSLRSHNRYVFDIHFNIILKYIYTQFSCSVSSQEYKWSIFIVQKHIYINLHFGLTWIRNNFLPKTPDVQLSALKSSR